MSEKPKSVYLLGAEDGLIMGPIMAATIFLIGASTYVAWVFVPALIAIFAVPVVAFFRLAYSHRVNHIASSSMTALWLQGICMFFFGGVVMAAFAFVMLRWAVPGFMTHLIDSAIAAYETVGSPTATDMADTFAKMKSAGMLPRPLDVALELLYLAVFTGSILSLLSALLIRRK